jgi:two-component system, NtrC family, C4-dicarboxylate transport sensor histidine kinase DctB
MKSMTRYFGLRLSVVVIAAMSVLAAYFIAAQKVRGDIRAEGERQLQIIAQDLQTVLEKHETLPFVLAFQPDMQAVLHEPDNQAMINHLNRIIRSIQRQAKVSAIYLMDSTGNTLASSNFDQPGNQNFIGQNFSFRPYFREAMSGKAGRFYAIGNVTNQPGYFISQPIYGETEPNSAPTALGVVAVKISLDEFERTWANSADPISLADSSGVVFLSNRNQWRYHSLSLLDHMQQDNLTRTRQYGGKAIRPLLSTKERSKAGLGPSIKQPVNRLGWQLLLFPSETRARHAGVVAATGVTLLLAIIGSLLWAAYQRRRRMEERLVSRKALQGAAEELEHRIALRTEELLLANQNIEARFTKLKETERLLRSTQNELVQAGKLTMLGQMAAGVTHELNQPLAAILAFADNAVTFLSRGLPDKAGENLTHISAAAARMGAIISQLKGFARGHHEALAPIDLAQSVRASALLVQNDRSRAGAELDVKILQSVQVMGDAVRIEQVLINLLRNALDATEGCAVRKITVTLECDERDAILRVRDSGPGISQQMVEHLFEPFFTTKPSGKGLGLGLAISSSIVQAMNGHLTAGNHPEGGAEFVLRLEISEVVGTERKDHAGT